jgi:hypothetical protein
MRIIEINAYRDRFERNNTIIREIGSLPDEEVTDEQRERFIEAVAENVGGLLLRGNLTPAQATAIDHFLE